MLDRCKQFVKRALTSAVCLMMMTSLAWGTVWVPDAAAAGVGSDKAAEIMNDRAASELDRVAGSGTSDALEGTVDSVVGKAKRDIGRATGDLGERVEGATDELKGKVKRDIGRTKSAADDASDELENKAEGFVDSVKDLFD